MKKFKVVLSILLIFCLTATLLAACSSGTSEQSNSSNSASDTGTSGSAGSGSNAGGTNEDAGTGGEDEEVVTIKFLFDDSRGLSDHSERINEKINELIEPLIGVNIEITYMPVGDFVNQARLTIAGGEVYDLMSMDVRVPVGTLYSSGQLLDITDYLYEYAPELVDLMGDYLSAYSYGGRICGVPTNRNFVANGYIGMRADILEELGLTEKAENMTSWSEFEEILAAVQEAYSDEGIWGISQCVDGKFISYTQACMNGDDFSGYEVFDRLSDTLGVVYTDQEGNIGLRQEQPGYVEECKLVQSWMDKGYVYPDAPFTEDNGYTLIKQGLLFSVMVTGEYGSDVAFKNQTTYEGVTVKVYGGMIETSTLNSWGIGVPITSEEPEAACKFLNLMYTNSELMNLFVRGEEGVDYEVVDGQVSYLSDKAYNNYDWGVGNQLLLTPLQGNGANFYKEVQELNDNATISKYLGFTLDTGDMDLVISQISSVMDQYKRSMECGLYTDELYEEYMTKLEAAGIRDYLQEVQDQLGAWLAQQ